MAGGEVGGGQTDLLPGLEVAVRGGATVAGSASARVERLGDNLWELCFAGGEGTATVRAQVELDVCGAWVTLAADSRRPMVLRRAGWVDLRGQPQGCDPWDRVGLGPGDSLVAVGEAALPDADLMAALLSHTGRAADEVAAAVVDALEQRAGTAVVRVPVLGQEESLRRVTDATGLAAEHFAEPLHPVGSPAAELWDSRPPPPRQARMRLAPRRDSVPAARGLLRRLLASWRMDELLDGHIELLASELLTNGVLHAATELDVVISYDGAAVRFEVHDRSSSIPELRVPDLEAEGGRGLWMVSELADGWAIEPREGGKRIWFEVSAQPVARPAA